MSAGRAGEKLADDRVRVDLFGLAFEVQQDPMTQSRHGDRADVLDGHERLAARQRVNLARQHERLRGARTRAVADVALHERRRVRRFGVRAEREPNRVRLHGLGNRHRSRDLAHLEDFRTVGHAGHRRVDRLRRPINDLVHRLFGRVHHLQLEEEAVELGFGQRIRALHLERVLRREHEEWLLELIGRPADRDAHVLHRLEQRRLRLGRRAVDLVGEDDVGEHRPLLELEERAAVRVLLHDVGADDVGRHQVGRELDPRELQMQHVGKGVHQARLAYARNPLEQHVPAGEQARDGVRHDVLVADDALANFLRDPDEAFTKNVDMLGNRSCRHFLRVK